MNHIFRSVSLTEPTWCSKCGGFLWGLANQGARCEGCNEVWCHSCTRLGGTCGDAEHNAPASFRWEVKLDGVWLPMEPRAVQQQLSKARADGQNLCRYSAMRGQAHFHYEVDLQRMVQKNNDNGTEREVRFCHLHEGFLEQRDNTAVLGIEGGGAQNLIFFNDLPEEDIVKAPFRQRAELVLGSGAIRLLSVRWLLQQPENWLAKRHQDMPAEAFVKPDDAARLFCEPKGVVVLSYGWLTPKHPDPNGFYVRVLRKYLKKHFDFVGFEEIGLFWDFVSLPQRGPDGRRSYLEEKAFNLGLKVMHVLYAAQLTVVIQIKQMPQSFFDSDGVRSNDTPYMVRGWCFFEHSVSSLPKPVGHLLDLSMAIAELDDDRSTWTIVSQRSSQNRGAPLHPEDMRLRLASCKFTSARSDKAMVGNLYDSFIADVGSQQLSLYFNGNISKMDAVEFQSFLRVLPLLPNTTELNLSDQTNLMDEELSSLVKTLPHLNKMSRLNISQWNSITQCGLKELLAVLPEMPCLIHLDLGLPALNDEAVAQNLIELVPQLKLRGLRVSQTLHQMAVCEALKTVCRQQGVRLFFD